MDKILLGYNRAILEDCGYNKKALESAEIYWEYERFAHILIQGDTGTGKTYYTTLLLARIGEFIKNASIYICDYKAYDFKKYLDCKNYYEFDGSGKSVGRGCGQGLDKVANILKERQDGSSDDNSFVLLCFDEWASFLNNLLDKKEIDKRKSQMATLLMLGRAFNIHVLNSMQFVYAKYYEGARNNFSVLISFGNADKETRQMLFSGFDKEDMPPVENSGEGFLLINRNELIPFKAPYYTNTEKIEHFIRTALNR
jgi:hypothetical protein